MGEKTRAYMRMKEDVLPGYYREPLALGQKGLEDILEKGKRVDLGKTLAAGGSAIFPHTYISKCGHQIASVVHGCLDSGSDQVVVLGVIHPLTDPLLVSRTKEINGEDISQESCWGVLGPGIDRDSCWHDEFSLYMFETLWDAEVRRRGIKPPRLIKRYPCLANRSPETLPGIDELASLSKDSVVVATSDLCHHGVAYGLTEEESVPIGEEALSLASEEIQGAFEALESKNYKDYYDACLNPQSLSDSLDVAPVLRHLLGPKTAHILDLTLVDVAHMFEGNPVPSWVAASLVEFKPKLPSTSHLNRSTRNN